MLGLLDDGWHKRHPLDGERKEGDPCIQVQTVRERLAGAADVGESCAKQRDERNRESATRSYSLFHTFPDGSMANGLHLQSAPNLAVSARSFAFRT